MCLRNLKAINFALLNQQCRHGIIELLEAACIVLIKGVCFESYHLLFKYLLKLFK